MVMARSGGARHLPSLRFHALCSDGRRSDGQHSKVLVGPFAARGRSRRISGARTRRCGSLSVEKIGGGGDAAREAR